MRDEQTTNSLSILGGIGLGAALMYFLDPARGTRRRHGLRDRLVRSGKVAGSTVTATSRDLRNRTRGAAAAGRARLRSDHPDDAVLVERVRSTLGRATSHPGAISVAAEDGRVTLAGPVLQAEAGRVLARVRRVRGVREVVNELEPHETAEHVSALQGGNGRPGGRAELAQERWTPSARLLGGAAGSALAAYGARRRDGIGTALGVAGLALAARGVTNLGAGRLTGVGAGRRALDVQKTITIDAPLQRVFAYFAAWENWPRWMSHVREVRPAGEGGNRTHWVVDGPAGVPVAWDAITTRLTLGEAIGWKSVEGAVVRHEGLITFTATDDGATTVDVRMSYNPPAGAVGHAVAAFFGLDPKRQMDDDLTRLMTTIETGTPPRDAAERVSRDAAGAAEPSLQPPR